MARSFEKRNHNKTVVPMKKNRVNVTIEDCIHCPNAVLKFDQNCEEDIMYCQTERSLIMLRDNGWGSCAIPNWCPRLNHAISSLRENSTNSER